MTLEYMPASTLLHPLDTRELRVYTGHKIYMSVGVRHTIKSIHMLTLLRPRKELEAFINKSCMWMLSIGKMTGSSRSAGSLRV